MERKVEEIENTRYDGTIWKPLTEHEVAEKELDPDEGNRRVCHVCTLPIFSTPYQMKEDGDDFLHKCCAKLPPTITDHPLHQRQPLYLHHSPDDGSRVSCNRCTRKCKGVFYQCLHSKCKFALDILCAVTVKILHTSHRHELTLIRGTENRFACSACGLEHKGEFYWCDVCGFYLHRDCALLPNAIILPKKHGDVDADAQPHSLILSFAFPKNALKFKKCDKCSICRESLSDRSGIYFCTKCDYTIHVKCAMSDEDDVHSVSIAEAANSVIHLPMMENEHTSLVQYLLEKDRNNSGVGIEGIGHQNKVYIDKIHDHELIFYEKYNDDNQDNESHFCNACAYPIYPPFYVCAECTNFYLHKCCANLPLHYHHPSMHYLFGRESCRDRPFQLLPRFSNRFLHIFKCSGCSVYCNGFVYRCKDCSAQLELECIMLPDAITYKKHGNSHILLLSKGGLPDYLNNCHACKKHIEGGFYYECCSCPNFKLHYYCALMPLTISHKSDRHLLELTSSNLSTPNEVDTHFCEICEQVMNKQSWSYQCKECATSFHDGCIYFVGGVQNYKYGETVRVRCHDCPVTFIYMLTNYSYTCGLCQTTIPGKEDRVAFECAKCGFWLHYYCAEKEWIGN